MNTLLAKVNKHEGVACFRQHQQKRALLMEQSTTRRETPKTAAEMLREQSNSHYTTFKNRPQGLTGQFSSLCDGDCGDGVCGQCN